MAHGRVRCAARVRSGLSLCHRSRRGRARPPSSSTLVAEAPPPGQADSILRSAARSRADDPGRRGFPGPNESLDGATSLCSQRHPRVDGNGSAFEACHRRPRDVDDRRSLAPIVSLKSNNPRSSHVLRAGLCPDRFPHTPAHVVSLTVSISSGESAARPLALCNRPRPTSSCCGCRGPRDRCRRWDGRPGSQCERRRSPALKG
jgi:hypothetical protein